MRPDFENLREDTKSTKYTGARLPELLEGDFTAIASEEEGGLTGLVIEGAARVVEDRKNDPAYLDAHPNVRRAFANSVEARIGALQAEMGSSQSRSDITQLQAQMDLLRADLSGITGGVETS